MIIDWQKIPRIGGMRAGSTRQGVCAEKMSAVRVVTEPETQFDGKTHWHDNEQILIMISGTVSLLIDGQVHEAGTGDLVFFPPGAKHAAIGCGPEGCVYYELFAPARPDQLPGWIGASVLHFE